MSNPIKSNKAEPLFLLYLLTLSSFACCCFKFKRSNMKYINSIKFTIDTLPLALGVQLQSKINPSTKQRFATITTERDKNDFPLKASFAVSGLLLKRFDDSSSCIPRPQTSQTLRSCWIAADLCWSAGERNPSGDAKQNLCPQS